MEEVRARVGHRELVAEGGARLDLWLREPGDPVHVVAEGDAVPVDRGRFGERVLQRGAQHAPCPAPDLRYGRGLPLRPGPAARPHQPRPPVPSSEDQLATHYGRSCYPWSHPRAP